MESGVFLGLGSNIGDREGTLEGALTSLDARGFRTTARSSMYVTDPVGGPPQDPFLNAVVRGETALAPEDLLLACLAVEAEMGRVRGVRNGPRTLDIDVLLFGGLVRDVPGLHVPHPRMHERRFVLVPLAEVAPEVRHPILGLTAAELCDRCLDTSRVVRASAWSRVAG